MFKVVLDANQQLPCPQKIVVKIYLDHTEKGSAQSRFENEQNAYRLSAKFAWNHVMQYYGEVQWNLASHETECFGVALQFFGGKPLSKSLVAKMSTDDRDKLTRRVYRLMRRMAKAGLSIGDINPDHVRVKGRGRKMIVRVFDFDQSYIRQPHIALIMNNVDMSSILQQCWVDDEVVGGAETTLRT